MLFSLIFDIIGFD